MAKNDRIYFDNLISAADQCCKAASYLVTIMNDYSGEDLTDIISTMHSYEHTADGIKHEMTAALVKAFVTPVDREDLAAISHNIDDVADAIEEVLQYFYMYNITSVTPEAREFAQKILLCCEKMKIMLGEFVNFKKPQKLRQQIIELSHMEEECDKLYILANRALHDHFTDPLEIISWREIYNRFENCADACEHVGDSLDMVVMKNS